MYGERAARALQAVWRLGVWRDAGCAPQAEQDHERYADQSEDRDHRPSFINRRDQTGAFEQRPHEGLHHRVGQDCPPDR